MKCRDCKWMETFKPRLGEPSAFGCKKPGFEGYLFVTDGEPHDPNLPVGGCSFGVFHAFRRPSVCIGSLRTTAEAVLAISAAIAEAEGRHG